MAITKEKLNKYVKLAMKHKDILGEGAKKRKHLNAQNTFDAVMAEHERGTLHSGSGKLTKSYEEAYAIALGEARKKDPNFKKGK